MVGPIRVGHRNHLADHNPDRHDPAGRALFEGNSQILDQILVSYPTLLRLPQYDSVHVNSEFFDQISDHDPQLTRLWFP